MEVKFTDIENAAIETAKNEFTNKFGTVRQGVIGCLILFCWPGTGRIFP